MTVRKKDLWNVIQAKYVVALAVALFYSSGFLGFGPDVREVYSQYVNPKIYIVEPIGWYISTLKIEVLGTRYYVGVLIISFLYFLSLFSYLDAVKTSFSRNFPILLITVILMFTHVSLFATLNILRQGLSMAALFLTIGFFHRNKMIPMVFFAIVSVLSHLGAAPLILMYFLGKIPIIKSRWQLPFLISMGLITGEVVSNYLSFSKSITSTAMDYRVFVIIIFTIFLASFIASKSYTGSRRHKLRFTNSSALVLLSVLVFSVSLFDNPSQVQRIIVFGLIPMIIEGTALVPIKKDIKTIFVILLSIFWASVSLNGTFMTKWNVECESCHLF